MSAPTIRTTPPGQEVRETHSDMGGHVLLRDRVGTARGTVLHERLWRLRLPFSQGGCSGTVKGKLFHARTALRLKLTNRLRAARRGGHVSTRDRPRHWLACGAEEVVAMKQLEQSADQGTNKKANSRITITRNSPKTSKHDRSWFFLMVNSWANFCSATRLRFLFLRASYTPHRQHMEPQGSQS